MKKPSIFSDRYSKDNKKRNIRDRVIVGLVLFLALQLFIVPYLAWKVYEYRANGNHFPEKVIDRSTVANSSNVSSKEDKSSDKKVDTSTKEESKSTQASENKKLEYKLKDGSIITINYSEKNKDVFFDTVKGDNEKFTYDISPNKNLLLISDVKEQDIKIFDKTLKEKDYTLEKYDYGGNGFMRRDVYIKRENFDWCKNPKFLDNDTVIYSSNVAIQLESKFIRGFKITDNPNDVIINETKSGKIEIKERLEEGIAVLLDGKRTIITPDLKIKK